jgi:hypothetical protein
VEQPGQHHADTATSLTATTRHPAGDRAEDRLAHRDPADVGHDAVGEGGDRPVVTKPTSASSMVLKASVVTCSAALAALAASVAAST